jgi:sphinganine-1-phosphate aldolase
MEKFVDANTFEPDLFKGTAQMNSDIVNSVIKLFHGDEDTHGMTTSGGTESIIASIAAYKLFAKKTKGITRPNLVFYESAHVAFMKGCYYFNIEIRRVPMNQNAESYAEDLLPYIDSNTIAIVVSACNYAHGAIDDIEGCAKIALQYGIGMHVDNCLGGFINCFADEFKNNMFGFDFRVKGVTSISCDIHKYGYGPKGQSVMMLRPKALFDALKFTSLEHSGAPFSMDHFGTYRAGAILAGSWVALMKTGYKTYVAKTEKIYNTTKFLREEIQKIPQVKLYSPNNGLNMVCFDTENINSIFVSLKMKENDGWHLSECQRPCVLHLLVSDSNVDMASKFLEDLRKAIGQVEQNTKIKKSGYQTLYGVSTIINDKEMLDDLLYILLDAGYSTTSEKCRMSINID